MVKVIIHPASNAVVVTTSGSLPVTPVIWLKLDEGTTILIFETPELPPVYFSRSSLPKAPLFSGIGHKRPDNVGGLYAADYGTVPANAYIESDEQSMNSRISVPLR